MKHGAKAMSRVIVMANDAGGADMFHALMCAEKDRFDWTLVVGLDSPASRIFHEEDINARLIVSGADASSAAALNDLDIDLVLYNPGWKPFPQALAKELRANGRKTVAVLDHWVNYRERFGYPAEGWLRALPDYVAVTDSSAYDLARKLGLHNVIKLRNYRMLQQQAHFQVIERARSVEPDALLFISQTIGVQSDRSEHFVDFGVDEEQVVREICSRFGELAVRFGVCKLIVRLHPAEQKFRFASIFKEYPQVPYSIECAGSRDLLESIADAGLVIGMNSMALFTAFMCGKPSFSVMPAEGNKCTLPMPVGLCVSEITQVLVSDFRQQFPNRARMDFFDDYDFGRVARTILDQ
jgi:hypothetical protein